MDFLKNKSPIIVCDIGASPIDKTTFIEKIINNTFSKLIGFEPNKKEFDKLDKSDPNKTFHNFAIGDGEEKILNICSAAGMSSFLEPDMEYLSKFHFFDKHSKIIKKEKVKTVSLGKDINSALARRVEELQKFKSDFFGRVRALIKGRKEIRIVGDRFVFQSEVLFTLGSDELGEKGQLEMIKLASTLTEIEKSLPTDIDWILQIDGHTDNLPVKPGQSYKDNWELSTKRALSVLRFLIKQGIKPNRLSASGYGSFQPIDNRNLITARTKNRRIEMKITQSTKLK